jgi:hypothetical protein
MLSLEANVNSSFVSVDRDTFYGALIPEKSENLPCSHKIY